MSGTYPATPTPAQVTIRSVTPTLVSVTQSLRRQARSRGGQRWSFSLQYATLDADDLAPIVAFLHGQRGQYEEFSFVLPSRIGTARGTGGGTPRVNNNATSPSGAQSGRSLWIDGCTAGVSVWGAAGDFFTVAGDSKVYRLTGDVASDGSGNAQLVFEPALMASPADNALVTLGGVTFTVSNAQDSIDEAYQPGPFLSLSVQLVEVA